MWFCEHFTSWHFDHSWWLEYWHASIMDLYWHCLTFLLELQLTLVDRNCTDKAKLALHTWVMMVLNPGLIMLPSPLLFVVQSPQYTQFKMAQIYPTITLWHSCQTSLKLYWTVHQRLNALLQLFGQRPPLKTFADIKMLTPDLWQP